MSKKPFKSGSKGVEEIKVIQKDVDSRKLKITGGHNIIYDFGDYKTSKEFFRDLYYRNMTIDEAERKQDKFDAKFGVLEIYVAKKKDTEAKKKLLNNAKNFCKSREKNIKDFKNGLFPLNYDDEEKQETRDKEEENNTRNENGLINYKKLNRLIHLKERDIYNELVRKHFLVQNLVALLEKFWKLKNNAERNGIQVTLTNSGLRDHREEIENISE